MCIWFVSEYFVCNFIFQKVNANLFVKQLSIAIVCIQLNDFKYCNLTPMILFSTNHFFAYSEVLSSIAYMNSFICTQLKGSYYC